MRQQMFQGILPIKPSQIPADVTTAGLQKNDSSAGHISRLIKHVLRRGTVQRKKNYGI